MRSKLCANQVNKLCSDVIRDERDVGYLPGGVPRLLRGLFDGGRGRDRVADGGVGGDRRRCDARGWHGGACCGGDGRDGGARDSLLAVLVNRLPALDHRSDACCRVVTAGKFNKFKPMNGTL